MLLLDKCRVSEISKEHSKITLRIDASYIQREYVLGFDCLEDALLWKKELTVRLDCESSSIGESGWVMEKVDGFGVQQWVQGDLSYTFLWFYGVIPILLGFVLKSVGSTVLLLLALFVFENWGKRRIRLMCRVRAAPELVLSLLEGNQLDWNPNPMGIPKSHWKMLNPREFQYTNTFNCKVLPIDDECEDIHQISVIQVEYPETAVSLVFNRYIQFIHALKCKIDGMTDIELNSLENHQDPIVTEETVRNDLKPVLSTVLTELSSSEDFKLIDSTEDVSVFRKVGLPSNEICVKVSSRLDAPRELVLRLLMDIKRKPEYDHSCDKAWTVREYSESTKVFAQQLHGIWPLTAREFCHTVSIFQTAPEVSVLVSQSIEDELVPYGKHVRAVLLFGGFRLTSVGSNGCLMESVLKSDMKSKMPGFILDIAAKMQGVQVRNMRRLLKAEKSAEIQPSLGKIDFLDETPQHLVEEALDRALKAEHEEWEFVTEKDGVKVTRKGQLEVKGEGVIHGTPLQVIKFIEDLERKKQYDPMFDYGHLVEELDPATKVVYQKFKGIWPVSPRDFCTLVGLRMVQDTVILVGISYTHKECPVNSSIVRGTVKLGTFICRRLSDSTSSLVYVAEVDLGGSVPASVLRHIAVQQPMVVSRIRDAFDRFDKSQLDGDELKQRFEQFQSGKKAESVQGKEERIEKAIELSCPFGGWDLKKKQYGVDVSVKMHGKEYTVKAAVDIDASIQVLSEILFDVSRRHWFQEDSGIVLKKVEDDLDIVKFSITNSVRYAKYTRRYVKHNVMVIWPISDSNVLEGIILKSMANGFTKVTFIDHCELSVSSDEFTLDRRCKHLYLKCRTLQSVFK